MVMMSKVLKFSNMKENLLINLKREVEHFGLPPTYTRLADPEAIEAMDDVQASNAAEAWRSTMMQIPELKDSTPVVLSKFHMFAA